MMYYKYLLFITNGSKWIQTRKGGNCDALQLEGRPMPWLSFWALITRPILH